jgi:putative cell wall-binding protein
VYVPKRLLLLCLALVLSLGWMAQADSSTIFIRTQPYKGPTMKKAGHLYLPLNQFVQAMGLKSHQVGSNWAVSDPWHPDTVTAGTTTATATLFVNGQAVADGLLVDGNQTWINAEVVTQALGGYYKVDTSLGMIDMGLAYQANARPATASGTSAPAGHSVVVLHWFAHW